MPTLEIVSIAVVNVDPDLTSEGLLAQVPAAHVVKKKRGCQINVRALNPDAGVEPVVSFRFNDPATLAAVGWRQDCPDLDTAIETLQALERLVVGQVGSVQYRDHVAGSRKVRSVLRYTWRFGGHQALMLSVEQDKLRSLQRNVSLVHRLRPSD